MSNIKKSIWAFGAIIALFIIGFGFYFYFSGKSSNQVAVNSSQNSKVKSKSSSKAVKPFTAIDFYKDALGMDTTGVLNYFKTKGVKFKYNATRAEAIKTLQKLKEEHKEVSNKTLNGYLKNKNVIVPSTMSNYLVVNYGVGYSDAQLLTILNKAKGLGLNNIYSYSEDGISDAKSLFDALNTNTKNGNFTGGVETLPGMPIIYVVKDGKYNKILTKKLVGTNKYIDSDGNLLNLDDSDFSSEVNN